MNKNQNGDKRSKDRKTFGAIANFLQIGITMASCILVGVFLGRLLDELIGTKPWLLLIFSIFGIGAAIKSIFNVHKNK